MTTNDRRSFLRRSIALTSGWLVGERPVAGAPRKSGPRITFCGATRQVSGSCYLLETTRGSFLVDCGEFFKENGILDPVAENTAEFAFDARQIKAVFLTHAHLDHAGRLPLLYERGFRGPVYCTDCTRDIARVMLSMGHGVGRENSEDPPLYRAESVTGLFECFEAVPYNTKLGRHGLEFRFTDAGHILGSAMVEIWTDAGKVLFSGDMGNDAAPLLCKPTVHFSADVVVVESTYGTSPREAINHADLGRRVQQVIAAGGSVLFPAFACHKTQLLLCVLHQMKDEGILDRGVPIYSDSSTAQEITRIYNRYRDYYDPEASRIDPFYRDRYFECSGAEALKAHGKEPAVYISTHGMLDFGSSAKHFAAMAEDKRNAVFFVGWQHPDSLGRRVLDAAQAPNDAQRFVAIPIDVQNGSPAATRRIKLNAQVAQVRGLTSHAAGEQMLDWLASFREIGNVYVVHGDQENATGLANAIRTMDLQAVAVTRNQTIQIRSERRKPGGVPRLPPAKASELAPVDT